MDRLKTGLLDAPDDPLLTSCFGSKGWRSTLGRMLERNASRSCFDIGGHSQPGWQTMQQPIQRRLHSHEQIARNSAWARASPGSVGLCLEVATSPNATGARLLPRLRGHAERGPSQAARVVQQF